MNEQGQPVNIITIKTGKKTRDISVPRSWDDLDDRRFLLFLHALFTGSGDALTAGGFTAVKLISMLEIIMGVDVEFLKEWEADCVAEDAEHGRLVFLEELKEVMKAALGGLFEIVDDEETGATGYAVRYNRTRNVWPSLVNKPPVRMNKPNSGRKLKPVWLYAPKDGLSNITLYELAMSFATYEAYVRTGDVQYANRLIGILYRPSRPETREDRESGWHGDRRQPLRRYEDMVERRAKLAATLPLLTRRAIVFWFAGCREAIVQRYPRVFKRSDSGKGGGDWGKLLLSLAETGTFGELGQTSDQHFSNGLTFLSMKDEQREEAERAMEAARRKRR